MIDNVINNSLKPCAKRQQSNDYGFKYALKQLFPTLLLSAIFLGLCFALAFCYVNIFFPLKYSEDIKSVSHKYDVSPALVASIVNAESGFNSDSVSTAGAIGLMQLMPETANYIALRSPSYLETNIDLTDAQTNLDLGVSYVQYLLQKFNDPYTMLCAYNAGEGKVMQWLTNPEYSQDGKTLFTTPYKETNYYARKVLRSIPYYQNRIS